MKHTNVHRSPKQALLIAGGVFVALAVVLAGLELTNTTHLFHKQKVITIGTASQNTKGEPAHQTTTPGSATPSSTGDTTPSPAPGSPTGSQQKEGGSTSATLLTPSGDFVSNHHPNLGSHPAPNEITSVCTTTPGATCKITFTKDGLTKELPTQAADAGGSAYWDWKLQDYGLTTGTWHVQAVATLNGQSKTANDATDLVVSP